ncbi:MAG: TlpA family protein disulfide reductase [Saprospiraceae bacterium]|nr:TlpA family protein disulfide reductase [Saprospiraceae bacterium]
MINFLKKNKWLLLVAVVALYVVGKYLYAKPRFINGEIAPNFRATTHDNQPFDLSLLRGQYVCSIFWGSWCGPCLKEMPDLVRLYSNYHDKKLTDATNFTIVSVGIETEREKWLSAIEKMNARWQYHISDLKNMDSPIAQQYGVRVIPTKFLLNTEGVIIGVNQSSADIEKFLATKILK